MDCSTAWDRSVLDSVSPGYGSGWVDEAEETFTLGHAVVFLFRIKFLGMNINDTKNKKRIGALVNSLEIANRFIRPA